MPTGRAAADDAASDLALGGRTPSGSSSDSDDFEDEAEVAEEPLSGSGAGSPTAWAGGSGMGILPAEAEVAADSGSPPAWGGSDVGIRPVDAGGGRPAAVTAHFVETRLGVYFSETNSGEVVVSGVDESSEAVGIVARGMVLTHIGGKDVRRAIAWPTPRPLHGGEESDSDEVEPALGASLPMVVALLKAKTARPLTLEFTTAARRAREPVGQTKLRRPPPDPPDPATSKSGCCGSNPADKERGPPPRLLRPGRAPARLRAATAAERAQEWWRQRNPEWGLAADASGLLRRRRHFGLWKAKYVRSVVCAVFSSGWNHRLLLRCWERWVRGVEAQLATRWLQHLTLVRSQPPSLPGLAPFLWPSSHLPELLSLSSEPACLRLKRGLPGTGEVAASGYPSRLQKLGSERRFGAAGWRMRGVHTPGLRGAEGTSVGGTVLGGGGRGGDGSRGGRETAAAHGGPRGWGRRAAPSDRWSRKH